MTRFETDRKFHIPKEYDELIEADDVNAVIYYYSVGQVGNERLAAVAFSGKRQKPDFHHTYPSSERRARHTATYLEALRTKKADTERRRKARQEFKHDLEVDNVLVCTWGYEQTNVDFYQVLEVKSAKTIVIQRIGSRIVTNDTRMYSGTCEPVLNNFWKDSQPMTKRVQLGGYVRVRDFSGGTASKWDGRPEYFSNDY